MTSTQTRTETDLPHWARKLVGSDGLDLIRDAVKRVEMRTSAEIVPMLVRSSHPAGHVSLVLFLLLLVLAWSLMPILSELVPQWPLWVWELASFVLAALFSFLLRDWAPLRRWFTPRADQALSVERRALLEFHLGRVEETEHRTGILIMASLHEHRAVILADHTIDQSMPADSWQKAIALLLSKTRSGDFAGGMVAAIDHLGDLLEPRFPAGPGKKNQLENGLVLKE